MSELPDDFFEIDIERDEYKSISDDGIKKIIRKILAVSNLIYSASRRGGPDKIIFNGKLGKFIYENIKDIQYITNADYIVNDISVDGFDNIELIRSGDFVKVVYDVDPDDITGMGRVKLERTKRKQPDLVYKIKIKE